MSERYHIGVLTTMNQSTRQYTTKHRISLNRRRSSSSRRRFAIFLQKLSKIEREE